MEFANCNEFYILIEYCYSKNKRKPNVMFNKMNIKNKLIAKKLKLKINILIQHNINLLIIQTSYENKSLHSDRNTDYHIYYCNRNGRYFRNDRKSSE